MRLNISSRGGYSSSQNVERATDVPMGDVIVFLLIVYGCKIWPTKRTGNVNPRCNPGHLATCQCNAGSAVSTHPWASVNRLCGPALRRSAAEAAPARPGAQTSTSHCSSASGRYKCSGLVKQINHGLLICTNKPGTWPVEINNDGIKQGDGKDQK